jgi:hypothetical protein
VRIKESARSIEYRILSRGLSKKMMVIYLQIEIVHNDNNIFTDPIFKKSVGEGLI